MTALLEVDNLEKHFPVRSGQFGRVTGFVKAVDGISFTVNEGQTLALVGESGCGKTTTAQLILRLLDPTAGQVVVGGADVQHLKGDALKQFRLDVQPVFQDPWGSLSPRRRVADIVAEPLVVNQVVGKKEARQRVEELLVRVGLRPDHADLFPHEFSGGQRQRIALASALITFPKLIILDEPVSALDVSVQAQVLNLLRRIQRERNTAFLLIAHNLATVRYIADRVAVMYMGQIVEEGPVARIYREPRHPYTKALFDSTLPFHPDGRRDIVVEGEPPNPIDPPSGCRFRTRCPFAMEVCEERPPVTDFGDSHLARCHLYPASEVNRRGSQKPR